MKNSQIKDNKKIYRRLKRFLTSKIVVVNASDNIYKKKFTFGFLVNVGL